MGKIPRHAFNSGELSPNFWWSTHLDRYYNGNRQQQNFIGTVSGSTKRRDGTKRLKTYTLNGSADYYVAQFDYQVTADEYNTIVFVAEQSYELANLFVLDGSGQVLYTTETNFIGSELAVLQDWQSFDIIFFTSSTKPTMKLTAFDNNVFTFELHQLNGGPFQPLNQDRSSLVGMQVKKWVDDENYTAGESVFIGENLDGVGSTEGQVFSVYYGGGTDLYRLYYTVVYLDDLLDLKIGDKITILGSTPAPGSTSLDGNWVINDICTTCKTVKLNTGSYSINGIFKKNLLVSDVNTALIYKTGQRQTFYKAIVDNINEDPESTIEIWAESFTFSGICKLTANDEIFHPNDVGSKIRIQQNQSSSVKGTFTVSDEGKASQSIQAYGEVSLRTEGGVYAGEIALQVSNDKGISWDDARALQSVAAAPKNGEVLYTVTDFGAMVRVFCRERLTATGDTGCVYYLEVIDKQFAYLDLIEFIDARTMVADCPTPVTEVANNWRWSFGSFSERFGYPSVIGIINDRMMLSGVNGSPNQVFFSAIGDYESWIVGTFEDSAFSLFLPSESRNTTRWIALKDTILCGTDQGEFSISARDADLSLSAGNYKISRQQEYGSASVKAVATADLLVYAESGHKRVRSIQGSEYDLGNYESLDTTIMSDHLFETGKVSKLAYTRTPIPIVYALKDDGTLKAWVYEKVNQVNSWIPLALKGGSVRVLSISSGRTETGDDLIMTVLRDGRLHTEVISSDNPLLDLSETFFSPSDSLLYPTGVSEDFVVYDDAGLIVKNKGYILSSFLLRINITPTIEIIITDGTNQLFEGEDFVILGNGLYWLFSNLSYQVYDGNILLVEGTDYDESHDLISYHITFHNEWNQGNTVIIPNLPASPFGTPYEFPQSDGTTITIGVLSVTVEDSSGNPLLPDIDYTAVNTLGSFSPAGIDRRERIDLGIPIECILEPTDLTATEKLGGGAPHSTVSELNLFLINSMGGEISLDGGETYDHIDYDNIIDEYGTGSPDEFTGVLRQELNSDIGQYGTRIVIFTDDINPFEITCLQVNAEIKK